MLLLCVGSGLWSVFVLCDVLLSCLWSVVCGLRFVVCGLCLCFVGCGYVFIVLFCFVLFCVVLFCFVLYSVVCFVCCLCCCASFAF